MTVTTAVVVSLLSFAGTAAAAKSGDLPERAKRLAAEIASGDWTAAAKTARQLERDVATHAPLEIVDIQVLGQLPEGLGLYTPLFAGEVRGEEIFIYAQVRNHGIRTVAGRSELHLVSDLVILDGAGKELARDEAFGESRFNARAVHRDTFVLIGLRTKGLGKGAYEARIVLHDEISKKVTRAAVKFRIP